MSPGPRVRVLIVDDDEDIRALLNLLFSIDGRFAVVGEAADGAAAVELASSMAVDLIVLDRDMPVLDGLRALPLLRDKAPDAAIVMYTAAADERTHQAALAGGAVGVVEKAGAGNVVEQLAETLVSHWTGPGAGVEIRVGPVAASTAQLWVDNANSILDAVAAHPEVLDEPLPLDALEIFHALLKLWRDIAETGGDFYWVARARPEDLDRLVRAWAAIDLLPDERIEALGCHWSPPEARPFFEALTKGVLDALARNELTLQLASMLAPHWSTTSS